MIIQIIYQVTKKKKKKEEEDKPKPTVEHISATEWKKLIKYIKEENNPLNLTHVKDSGHG